MSLYIKLILYFFARGDKVFGNVDVFDGRDFVLEPCAAFEGCHVWKV